MQELVKIAFVATNLVFVIAGAAYARTPVSYEQGRRSIEHRAHVREFCSDARPSERLLRRPPASVPEHIGPDFEVQGGAA